MLQLLDERTNGEIVWQSCETVRGDGRGLSAERADDRVVLTGQLLETSETETVAAGRQPLRLFEELEAYRTAAQLVQLHRIRVCRHQTIQYKFYHFLNAELQSQQSQQRQPSQR